MKELFNSDLYKDLLGNNYENLLIELRKPLVKCKLNIGDARLVLRMLANDLEYFSVVKE